MICLEIGYILQGKYRVLRALGRGGEGSVWLACHLQTEQLWAVKEIKKEKQRGQHELEMMKRIHNSSVSQIVDVLEDGKTIYLIMEYIRGRDLESWVRQEGRLSVWQVLDVGEQMADALCYLHSRSEPVYHLDLKPANIIRTAAGRLVLVDFGSARKAFQQEENRYGTVGFAAPEQYDLNKKVDGRTDIYGLGTVMYYLISGVRYSESLSKSRIPGCPETLERIIRKCIQADPEQRWQSSRVLWREIRKLKKKMRSIKRRYQMWAALLLAILTAGLAVHKLPEEFRTQAEQVWDYEYLLEEALCAGEEDYAFYQKAVFLHPERKDAYLQYLREADRDGVFSQEEERKFWKLLHTIPPGGDETYGELLQKQPEQYGEVASTLGMIYWYDYEKSDGRKIALGWFGRAVKAEENRGEGWWIRAKIFSHMGGYIESLGKESDSGEKQNPAGGYWKDMEKLMEEGFQGYGYPVTVMRFYRESLGQITFYTETFRKAGISAKRQKEMIRKILREAALCSGEESGVSEENKGNERVKEEDLTQQSTRGEMTGKDETISGDEDLTETSKVKQLYQEVREQGKAAMNAVENAGAAMKKEKGEKE